MKVTAFVDVLSHWCFASYPAIAALRTTIADDVHVEVVFAPAFGNAPVPVSHEEETWYYERGALAYGTSLSCAWCEGPPSSTWHANAAVAAAVARGADPLDLAAFVSHAAMREGALLGREDVAARLVSERIAVPYDAFLAEMRGAAAVGALEEGNARLGAIGCGERPSWYLENDAGDHASLQGVWQAEAILPLARALLDDERAYRRAGAPPA